MHAEQFSMLEMRICKSMQNIYVPVAGGEYDGMIVAGDGFAKTG